MSDMDHFASAIKSNCLRLVERIDNAPPEAGAMNAFLALQAVSDALRFIERPDVRSSVEKLIQCALDRYNACFRDSIDKSLALYRLDQRAAAQAHSAREAAKVRAVRAAASRSQAWAIISTYTRGDSFEFAHGKKSQAAKKAGITLKTLNGIVEEQRQKFMERKSG